LWDLWFVPDKNEEKHDMQHDRAKQAIKLNRILPSFSPHNTFLDPNLGSQFYYPYGLAPWPLAALGKVGVRLPND
jgi:hypothetical protein